MTPGTRVPIEEAPPPFRESSKIKISEVSNAEIPFILGKADLTPINFTRETRSRIRPFPKEASSELINTFDNLIRKFKKRHVVD